MGQDLADRVIVSAAQMQAIESRLFAAGMPVAALMEKVAVRISAWLVQRYPRDRWPQVGILVGPGHNGGDALVVARELHHQGYRVIICAPFTRAKELTDQHLRYATHLDIPITNRFAPLAHCDWLLDGLFGFGLNRDLTGAVAEIVTAANQLGCPIVSIDLPSGLHTDTGAVLGHAIRAKQTLCLGLWKLACFQESALSYLGQIECIDFSIPEADIAAVLGDTPLVQYIRTHAALSALPLARPITAHKYQVGRALLICGSSQYSGAALLAGLGARASGPGMLSIAVPASLQNILRQALPEALIIPCPETATGAIAQLPPQFDLSQYDAIGCGCGLTLAARSVVETVWQSSVPAIFDADGLNCLSPFPASARNAPTILTPHFGEFRRLFPGIPTDDRLLAIQQAARASQAIVLLKGARTLIADAQGNLRCNTSGTPGLARGGSGDVLTGLITGLLSQTLLSQTLLSQTLSSQTLSSQTLSSQTNDLERLAMVAAAAWWHGQAGTWLAASRSLLGVDPQNLANSLIPALQAHLLQSHLHVIGKKSR
jgi:NAD(P)H-hydrate epimerase